MGNWTTAAADTSGALRGRPLRYLLVETLRESARDLCAGEMSVPELIVACEMQGVVFDGRASKLLSDALRWEVQRGRITKTRRGVYTFAEAPRSTRYWIAARVDLIRQQLRWAAGQRYLRQAADQCDDLPPWWSSLMQSEPEQSEPGP